jgi:hypothetical protein
VSIYKILTPKLHARVFGVGQWSVNGPKNEDRTDYMFFCPGCGWPHSFPTPRWKFDGNIEAPTFSPSLRLSIQRGGNDATVCHLILAKGQITYCADCEHAMKGQTVAMADMPYQEDE